jgi:hypothetical protein
MWVQLGILQRAAPTDLDCSSSGAQRGQPTAAGVCQLSEPRPPGAILSIIAGRGMCSGARPSSMCPPRTLAHVVQESSSLHPHSKKRVSISRV